MGFWNDIEELPIWNYHKVIDTQDLTFLHDGKGEYKEEEAKEVWDNIRQQMIDRYGIDFELEQYYENMRALLRLKSEMLITGERFLINEIRIREAQMKEFESAGGVRNTKIYQQLSKYLGYRFDPRKETVVTYRETLLMIEEENNRIKVSDNG